MRASGIEEEAERWVRKLRGEGGRRRRPRGTTAADHDGIAGASNRAHNSNAPAQAIAAAASSASMQREKLVEGDPLAVLTPRTRKLVLRYSPKDDDEEPRATQPGKDNVAASGKLTKGPTSPAFLSVNAKGTASHSADDVLSLDLSAPSGTGRAAKVS